MDYKYTGIILSKRNVGETDRIYILYTAEVGKVKALGKGVRKPNAKLAGSLEPITSSEIFVAKTRGMGKITGAIAMNNFPKIKSDLDSLERTAYVFKIFEKITGEQYQDKDVFKMMECFLQSMEKISQEGTASGKKDILVLGFLIKLLDKMGYKAEMEKCVGCGNKLKPEHNFFSASRGGVLCEKCAFSESKKIRISAESIKLVRIFLKNSVSSLAKLQVSQKDIKNLKIVVQEALNWL